MTKNQLTRLTIEIIERGFPELSNIELTAVFRKSKDYHFCWGLLSPEWFFIEASTRLKQAPLIAVSGGLAHELVHITNCYKNIAFDNIADLIYKISRRSYIWNERRTDMEAVKRGFGKELVAFSEWAYTGKPENPERGLSMGELRSIVEA